MSEDFKNFNGSGAHQPLEEGEAAPVGDTIPDCAPEVADLRAKLDEQTDLHMRALADLDNFKKRMQREREEIRAAVTSAIIEELLPVLDHFELGLQSAEAHNAPKILEGFAMVFDQLKKILAAHGLAEIVPLNQEFNPHEHECVSHEYSDATDENTVIRVVRKGYKLNNRLIRPAMVAVSTKRQPKTHE